MPSTFDLDTAAVHGNGPVRLLALVMTMAVRDGAERVTLGPDPSPGVVGAEMTYFISGARYWLVPPPHHALPRLMQLFWQLAGGESGDCSFRLSGTSFVVRVRLEPTSSGERATFDLPALPALAAAADELLRSQFDENGLIEFDDSEFA